VRRGGAEWPLSHKFGCEPAEAADVLAHAGALGLCARGLSFHVGSQQPRPEAGDSAIACCAAIFEKLAARGVTLSLLNLGGGFPATYLTPVPPVTAYGAAIRESLRRHFGAALPDTIIEPGRGLVGDAA
jgi:ornithine decarboxylase